MTPRACKVCGKVFSHVNPLAVLCSRGCRDIREDEQRRGYNGGVDFYKLPTGTVGAMHEMATCVDLMRRGFYVFRSVSANSPFDLIATKGSEILRVEVTTGHRSKGGFLHHAKRDRSKFDILAIVEHSGAITYEPEL